ncbi:MAG TPA: hypothetical protein VGG15_09045 [Terriglobales bacterium]|jgi:hypothetical protein
MKLKFHRAALGLMLAAAAFAFVVPTAAQGQETTERLVLKDGSYQSVEKYEMQGDRVHYLSAERYEWEDIPASLVDWDATKKYNDELSSGKLRPRVIETPEEKEAREKEEANSPEISPGVTLPGSGGVFLRDEFKGKPEVAEIVQNGSEASKDGKKSVLRSAVGTFAGNKQGFEIKGEHAQIQSHVGRPTVYIDIDEGPINDATLNDRFRLVRVTVKKDARVIGNAKVSMGGKVSEQANFLPAKVEKLSIGQWIKLTPQQNLAPGEYAVVEMLSPQEINLYVWDFGVNPNAPANPNTWQPAPAN